MADLSVWVPVVSALGGAIAGGLISLATSVAVESRRERASHRKDVRDRRLRDLWSFHDATEALATSLRTVTRASWGLEPEETEKSLVPVAGQQFASARRYAARIRDRELGERLEEVNDISVELMFQKIGKRSEMEHLEKNGRFVEYLKKGDDKRVEGAIDAVRARIRSLLDELDPLN